MLHIRQTIVALIALAAVLTACTGPGKAAEPPDVAPERPGLPLDLDGTEWILTSLNGSSLVRDSNITLEFAQGRLTGFAGCNGYGGEYSAADVGTLTISEIGMTAQDCQAPEGVMQQEAAYVDALQNATVYRLVDDRLQVGNIWAKGTLVFSRKREFPMDPGGLVGTQWQLVSTNGSSLIERSTITLAFHDENQVSGRAACRGYRGAYEASGDDIRFPFLEMADGPCICPEELIEREGEYTTSLGRATNYRLVEGRLEVLTALGEVLIFRPMLEDTDTGRAKTTWALATFVEKGTATPVLAETEITLTFEDGAVSGSGGCNTYGAAYIFDGSFFTFWAPIATEMACSDPAGVMEQEQRYLSFLKDVTIYRIDRNQLRLETGDGRALLFAAQE